MSEVKRWTLQREVNGRFHNYVLEDDYNALKRVAEITSEFAMRRDTVATALAARVAHLEKYAGHKWTCDANILSDDDATKTKGLPCSCGFALADGGKPE